MELQDNHVNDRNGGQGMRVLDIKQRVGRMVHRQQTTIEKRENDDWYEYPVCRRILFYIGPRRV